MNYEVRYTMHCNAELRLICDFFRCPFLYEHHVGDWVVNKLTVRSPKILEMVSLTINYHLVKKKIHII